MPLDSTDLVALSRLLDQALDLDPGQLPAWLNDLPAQHQHLAPRLVDMMREHSQRAAADFMSSGPRLNDVSIGTADAKAGASIGPYRLIREIGRGGMGLVWLAERGDGGLKRPVALKLPRLVWGAGLGERMARERDIGARLEHPNLIRTYEFGEVNGHYFTAMEYLPGEDLAKCLDKLAFAHQQMPFHIAAGIVAKVCAGLHFAHQLTDTSGRPLNLIHRDVNPANVIVTYTGEVKVIDFGIAKTNATETQTGTIKGKIAYMSPEQLLARGVDQRSDVFSTGVVLWELLTGRPLFLRDNEAATLYAIMNEPIRAPSRLRPDVPPELDRIVMCALSRTPVDRYDTAEEMEMDLERFLAGQPKYDSRAAARVLEDLFGSTRAEAKRAIAQTRSLGRNLSLVMKLRTDVRTDLAEQLDSLATKAGSAPREILAEPEPHRGFATLLALVMLLAIAGGVLYFVYGNSRESDAPAKAVPQAALQIESDPAGAAISIDGEPTGLKTPATLTALTGDKIMIRLDLPGFTSLTESVDVPRTGTVTKQFKLGRY